MRSGMKGVKGKHCISIRDKIIEVVEHKVNTTNIGSNSEDVGDGVVPTQDSLSEDMDGDTRSITTRRLSKSASQLSDPTTPSPTSPVKIRRLSSRKSHTTERYKRI